MTIETIAYIDPGSGSLVLQVAIAGILGSFGYFRAGLWRMVRLVTGRTAAVPSQNP